MIVFLISFVFSFSPDSSTELEYLNAGHGYVLSSFSSYKGNAAGITTGG